MFIAEQSTVSVEAAGAAGAAAGFEMRPLFHAGSHAVRPPLYIEMESEFGPTRIDGIV